MPLGNIRHTVSTPTARIWNGPPVPTDLPKLSELMNDEHLKQSSMQNTNIIICNDSSLKVAEQTTQKKKRKLNQNRKNNTINKDIMKLVTPLPSTIKIATTTMQRESDDSKRNGADHHHHHDQNQNLEKQMQWKADYASSRKTQDRITAASKFRKGDSTLDRAERILTVFLNTPPIRCNEANVVHTLTLTAKILSRESYPPSASSRRNTNDNRENVRKLLHQTLDILHDLVKQGGLTTRQLANAAWAIAKHYSMDPLVVPPKSSPLAEDHPTFIHEETSMLVLSEVWDLDQVTTDEDETKLQEYERQKRVLETMDEIAERLITVMKTTITEVDVDDTATSRRTEMSPPKSSELSMVSWAYATLNPRMTPAGWELPPRSGKVSKTPPRRGTTAKTTITTNNKTFRHNNVVSFEKWDDFALLQEQNKHNGDDDDSQRTTTVPSGSTTITDKLFDTIASTILKFDIDREEEGSGGVRMLEGCLWRELSNIAWSYAHRGQCKSSISLRLMQELAEEACQRLKNFDSTSSIGNDNTDLQKFLPRDVSVIAWALGSLQCDNYRLSDALVTFVDTITTTLIPNNSDHFNDEIVNPSRPLQNWQSADLVQLSVALAHGRIDMPELLIPIYDEVLHSMEAELLCETKSAMMEDGKEFKSWELAALLWVQASLYLTEGSGRVFEEFSEVVPSLLLLRIESGSGGDSRKHRNWTKTEQLMNSFERIGLGAQEQANIAWSLAVLDNYKSPETIQLLQNIFTVSSTSSARGNRIGLEHAHQLWQSVCILEDDCPEALGNVARTTTFYSFLRDSWFREKSRPKMSSARHKNISKTLDLMGVLHYNEHDEDIDVAIVLKLDSEWTHTADNGYGTEIKRKVAVEFDGPTHFTRPRTPIRVGQKPLPPRALGHTVLKYKILKRQGWAVVRVPYYEFDKIPFWASMERQRYLQRKLKTHANIRFSRIDVSEYKAQVANRQSRFD